MNCKKNHPGGNRGENQELKKIKHDHFNTPAIYINRNLPNDKEAERNLLRALIASPDAVDKAAVFLEPADFYLSGCTLIFERLLEFRDNGGSFTPSLVVDSFQGHQEFDRLSSFVCELGPFWMSCDWPHWAKIVRDLAIRRKLIAACLEAVEACWEIFPDVGGVISRLLNEVATINDTAGRFPVKGVQNGA